jgi:EpsI family protein
MGFLTSKPAIGLTAVLLVQGALYYATAARSERTAPVAALQFFSNAIGPWQLYRDAPIDPEVQDVLKADDTLNRVYEEPSSGAMAILFIAYFKTQRTGASPHSPKNCLPGAGWEPVETPGIIPIQVAGRPAPIVVNRYVVARGDAKSVVLYWYQSHGRIIASEYSAKLWLIADAIRYHRSDTALIKVVVPFASDSDSAAAPTAIRFVQAVYPLLAVEFPD